MTIIVKPTLTESLQQDRRSRAESGAKVETLRQEEPRPAQTVYATIDGIPVDVAPGATVLDAIRALGKSVPTLCYSDRMKPYGACRTCLVEHEGRKPIASCHTPVTDGGA